MVDVSNPASPQWMGVYDTSGRAEDVAVWGDYAYVADQTGGLAILRITPVTGVVYVDAAADGMNDGTSWHDAYNDLQVALEAARNSNGVVRQIWVAAGVYQPGSSGSNPGASFELVNGVAIYGGFAGWENDLSQRDPVRNETVLSGGGNSYHVVKCMGVDATTVLEGVTITGGNARGSAPFPSLPEDACGGGVYNNGGSPRVANCVFWANSSTGSGGGLYNIGGNPQIVNCRFFGNQSRSGGALGNQASSPVLTNCVFSGNAATGSCPPLGGGGAIFNSEGSMPVLINCTLAGNYSQGACSFGGAGVLTQDSSNVTLDNCILWGNGPSVFPSQADQIIGGAPVVNHCCIQAWTGSMGGTGNIGDDPRFVDPDGGDNTLGTADDNLRISRRSPCADLGDRTALPLGALTDADGNPRIVNGAVDIGAYESHPLGTVFVDADASGSHTGTGWTDAFTDLQIALDIVGPGDEIWVAAGTYRPSKEAIAYTPRSATFQLIDGVAMYGGFEGGETDQTQRDLWSNKTILSGDLGGDDEAGNKSDNSYHVVTGSGTGESTVLDGFIITAGYADGFLSDSYAGGGMYNVAGSPAVRSCVFHRNRAGGNLLGYGGAIYNQSSNPSVTGCVFRGNSATGSVARGGAIHSSGDSLPVLVNCVFTGNTAAGSPAGGRGGAIYSQESSPALINCSFCGNGASGSLAVGGAVSSDGTGNATITNCILWGNTDASAGGESSQIAGQATVSHSCIQDKVSGDGVVQPGAGNIDRPPILERYPDPGLNGWDGVDDDYGDLHLQLSSPSIDAGDNSAVPVGVLTDLAGTPRIVHGKVDMGAYEAVVGNQPPIAQNRVMTVDYETSLSIQLLAEDRDQGPSPLTYAVIQSPTHGVLNAFNSSTGQVIYEPASRYSGPDSFTFKVSDGEAESNMATVSITVEPASPPPPPPPSTGSLTVTIVPAEAVAAGAQWQVGGGPWQDSGATISSLSVGGLVVSFKDVTNWIKPAAQTADIVANQTTAVTGTYTSGSPTGQVTVTISPPEAVTAGAQWRVDAGPWQDSGATVSGLVPGVYTISFKDLNGWSKPRDRLVAISDGRVTAISNEYLEDVSLTLEISGPGDIPRVTDVGSGDPIPIVIGAPTNRSLHSEVRLRAEPREQCDQFSRWVGTIGTQPYESTSQEIEIQMTADTNLTAEFTDGEWRQSLCGAGFCQTIIGGLLGLSFMSRGCRAPRRRRRT